MVYTKESLPKISITETEALQMVKDGKLRELANLYRPLIPQNVLELSDEAFAQKIEGDAIANQFPNVYEYCRTHDIRG